jgi:CrcB protein
VFIYNRRALKIYLVVGMSGSVGTILRYAVAEWTASSTFPLNTVLVNLAGSFVLGWFLTFIPVREDNLMFRAAVAAGLIGSFTTFSAFSLEMVYLLTAGQWFKSISYFSLHLIGGLLFAWIGYVTAQKQLAGRFALKGSRKQ